MNIDNIFQEGPQAASRCYPHSSCWVSLSSTFVDSLPPASSTVTMTTCLAISSDSAPWRHVIPSPVAEPIGHAHSAWIQARILFIVSARAVSHFPLSTERVQKMHFLPIGRGTKYEHVTAVVHGMSFLLEKAGWKDASENSVTWLRSWGHSVRQLSWLGTKKRVVHLLAGLWVC